MKRLLAVASIALAFLALSCKPGKDTFERFVPADALMTIHAPNPARLFKDLSGFMDESGLSARLGGGSLESVLMQKVNLEPTAAAAMFDFGRPCGAFIAGDRKSVV